MTRLDTLRICRDLQSIAMKTASLPLSDRLLSAFSNGLNTVFGQPQAGRTSPAQSPCLLGTAAERRESAALMRVNHVGEVCAQALYQAQALWCKDETLRAHFLHAAGEEVDHLAWTQARLKELNDRPSLLNPLWYAGAFTLGSVAALTGDARSLGFLVETERQVEAHLASHLDLLPSDDQRSREIVIQMKTDEAEHAHQAQELGAAELPQAVPQMMRWAAKVMTTVAHRI